MMTTTTSKAIHTNWKPAIAIPTSRRIKEFNSFSRFFLSFRSDSVLKACLLLIITLLYYMKKKNEKKNIPLTVCCCGFYIFCSRYVLWFYFDFHSFVLFFSFLLSTGNCIHCCYSEYNGTRIANRAHFSIYFHLIHNKLQKLCMFFCFYSCFIEFHLSTVKRAKMSLWR